MDPIETLINQAISKVVTASQCKLCDVKMINSTSQSSHLSGKRHKANIILFKEKVRQSVTSNLENARRPGNSNIPTEVKQFHCKACNRKFGAQLDLNNHNSTESHLRNVECYCFTCSVLTQSKQDLWDHLRSGTHNNKLETLGYPPINGKYTPFGPILAIDLRNQMHADYCYICKTKFPTIQLSVGHYTSLGHEKAAELWLKTYSGINYVPSKQEVVNQSEPKQSKQPGLAPRFLNLRQQSISNSSENMQQAQKVDLEPADLNSKPSKSLESEPKSPNCDNAANKTETAQSSSATKQENSDDSENLKNKVFSELEKLVQKLYYSKEVPYNVGLNYLKKINKEVDEIITTNNDDKEKLAFSIELDEAACSNNNFNQNGFNFTGFTKENAKPLIYPVNFGKPIDLINVSDTLENNANTQFNHENNTEIRASKKKPKLKTPTNNKSIPDLLEDVILKKQNCNENADELELLSEIEVLLKQLENVEEGPLLENILKCLQGYNKELDEIDFKKLEDDQKINIEIEKNNVEENVTDNVKAIAVEPKSKFVYSKNDLLSLDPWYGNQRENPSSIYNYYSGEDFNQFMEFVDVYQQGSFDDQKNPEVDNNYEVNIYSYYSGTDFNEFMNFTEVYLQGSIKHLNKEP